MAEYLVTLAIETYGGEGSPEDWDWATLLDTPYPADVIACADVTEMTATKGLAKIAQVLLSRIG